ncbi:MAG: C4-dicarboxylate ABC transporter permease, partial [Alphaproteobacteria bacterium]|nr:C4-dicarboxylate ABC transporter permease [Alphaproteobacteria bacterium]
MTVAIMLVLFTILMCIGVPIAHAMGLAAALAMLWEGQVPVLQLAQSFYQAIDG